MLDVRNLLRPERSMLLDLLGALDDADWSRSTECPAYSVKGIATHVLGDDLSLLSRQRDAATNGLMIEAECLPGADLRTILDSFNDRWVAAARFMSPAVVIDLLGTTGERTAEFYESVDLAAPCEPVGFFGSTGEPSPYWQAVARELVERWVHHSQIRRAVGLPSLGDPEIVRAGVAIVAAAGGVDGRCVDDDWFIGPLRVGSTPAAADLLTRALRGEEIRDVVTGPGDAVEMAIAAFAR